MVVCRIACNVVSQSHLNDIDKIELLLPLGPYRKQIRKTNPCQLAAN
jgi:hypothetical protein